MFGTSQKILAQTIPGCTSSTKFSPMTGQPCAGTASAAVTSGASIDMSSLAAQANSAQGAKLIDAVKAMVARMKASGQTIPSALKLIAGDYRGMFTKTLTVGTNDAQVKLLQQFLNWYGFEIAKTGAGSVGGETTYFGPATSKALAKFQAASGISPASGLFGPMTRAYVESLSK